MSSNGENNSAPQEGATEQQQAATDSLEGLPEEFGWVKQELTKARNEAARYRTERNDERTASAQLKERLEGAVTKEDFEAARSEWATERHNMVRDRIIKDHKLPEDLAELLKGDDEASLAEHAAKLAKYVPKDQPDPAPAPENPAPEPEAQTPAPLPPSGGRDPLVPADDVDPADLVKIAKKRGFH